MAATPLGTQQRLVISVDFGTTFSGVAYAFSDDRENVEVIHDWPNGGNRTSDKVPTEILYLDADSGSVRPGVDGKRQYQWGYGISLEGRKNAEPLKWFKLLLHDRNPFISSGRYGTSAAGQTSRNSVFASTSTETNPMASMFAALSIGGHAHLSADLAQRVTNNTPASRTAAQLTRLRLSPVEVATDYLRSLREHILSVLERRFQAEFVRKTKIEYVLTVPAVWSDYAKDLTLQAARNAGFGEYETDFNLIGEPEAAAAYTLKAIQPNILNAGDTFVVCDAGGGTVDLVSYKIKELDPLSVDEIVGGSGDLCGSVFVNESFEEHVRDLLGDDVIDRMRPIAKREMMRQWEEKVKFKFADSNEIENYEIYIPGVGDNEEKGLEAGFLSLSRATVKNIFDPIIDRIVELVDDQIRRVRAKGGKVSAILLVGGFGASEYLRKRLLEHDFVGGRVEVMQPRNAWSAITRGALIRGLTGSFVKDQIARRHYGLCVAVDYKENKGWEKYRQWNEAEQIWVVPNQMIWSVDKGIVITEDLNFSIPCYRVVERGSSLLFETKLLACNRDDAPSWNNPEHVFTVGTMTADLSKLPFNRFDMFKNVKGRKYWRVHYTLEMTIVGGIINFSLVFEGKSYGKVPVVFH
ncbi:hypothetical protein RUND412_001157 [Rhizina undulata]